MDVRSRARLVNRLADAFEANLEALYRLETLNNGRPINETRAQLSRLPDFFRYFAGLALARRDHVIPVQGPYLNYTLRTPVGVVANCTPFNHPLMIMCKSQAAVLASGCTTVVKPSEYTPLTTLKLAEIFIEAGLPPGVFNEVLGYGGRAGRFLTEHRDINKIVLTGGTEPGRIVGAAAAKVFAHQTLELGGKTPVMVFEISTSTRRSTTPPLAPSSVRARPASAAAATWCSSRSTTSSWRSWRPRPRRSASATPSSRRPNSAR
jgi:acyl-CoA reductase-like NAD-dependent aldehyde dehydrogenase